MARFCSRPYLAPAILSCTYPAMIMCCRKSVARWFNRASLVDCDFTPMPSLPAKSNPRAHGWEVNVELRRGVTVEGQVIGPDGKRVQNASIISRVILEPYLGPYRFWSASYQGAVHDGHFELHGLDPDTEVPVFFLEPNRKLGATLRPFGRPPRYACRDRSDQLSEQSRVRRRRADCAARPDPGCDLPHHRSHERAQCIDPQVRKEFIIKPGETLDPGDILIQKPQVR